MKSKLLVVVLIGLLCAGLTLLIEKEGSASFRAQLSELGQLRESGQITEQEYHSSKSRLLSVMLH